MRPHDVPHAPPDHRLADQQRPAGRGIARLPGQAHASVDRIATAAEAHRLDRHGGHAGFGDLDREVVLVARLVGALAALFVDADDVIHTAAVARHANHHSRRAAHFFWKQEIREHADAGLAVEHDLLAHVTGKRTCLECDRA